MQVEQFLADNILIMALSIATMPIKGFALWYSARFSQKWWFILLFVTSTVGILDLIYIFFVARKRKAAIEVPISN